MAFPEVGLCAQKSSGMMMIMSVRRCEKKVLCNLVKVIKITSVSVVEEGKIKNEISKKISKEDVINYVLLDSYCLILYCKISIFFDQLAVKKTDQRKGHNKKSY